MELSVKDVAGMMDISAVQTTDGEAQAVIGMLRTRSGQ